MDTTTARTLTMNETTMLIRKALKSLWPGVKFSVRKDRGTACGWVTISWEDGPTDRAVTAAVDHFHGSKFNGQTDMYDLVDDVLMAAAGELPALVRFPVDGILTMRQVGEAGRQAVAEHVQAVCPHLRPFDGEQTVHALLSTEDADKLAPALSNRFGGSVYMADVVGKVFAALDLS